MRAMESTRKKLEASEEKRFGRQVLLKWWRHQKHLIRSTFHKKHISSEAGRSESSKGCSKDLFTPYHCRRLVGWSSG